MTKRSHRRQFSRYLSRRIVAAHNVLNNPMSSDEQRRGARCRLNRTVDVLRRLPPIPAMKRAFQVDIDAEKNPFRVLAA